MSISASREIGASYLSLARDLVTILSIRDPKADHVTELTVLRRLTPVEELGWEIPATHPGTPYAFFSKAPHGTKAVVIVEDFQIGLPPETINLVVKEAALGLMDNMEYR